MSTYTEEEAKKLWCPEARVAGPYGASINRVQGEQFHAVGSTCKASGCMAWRKWNPDERGDDRGYCGKAGRPSWGPA